jgi:hypothetical protein
MKRILTIIFLIAVFNSSFGQVKSPIDDDRKIRIPVIFHVLYNNNTENINDSLITSELGDLNLDFSAINNMNMLDNDFRNIVGNPNIEFYLLDTSFQETEIKGVHRVSKNKIKNIDALLIKPTNCLNVFIANQGDATPFIGGDRVNLNYKDVGIYSHVLTHETGHWLGLYHIFGQIGNSSWLNVTFGNLDDLIDDTPEQKRASAICYSITSTCPCPPENIYYKNHKTLFNNFMDYNPCRCMFTVGQSTKMRNYIIGHKETLFNSK